MIEERILNAVPLIKKEIVTVNRRIYNTILSLVVYVMLNNIPLFGVQQKNKPLYRFSITTNTRNSIFAGGRWHIFLASLLTNFLIKNKFISFIVGPRRTNIYRNKIRLLLELALSVTTSYNKTVDIFDQADSSNWIVMNQHIISKAIVFLELMIGGILTSYLQEFCTNYGFNTGTRIFLIVEYAQALIGWLIDSKYKLLETGLAWQYSLLFSSLFLYAIVLLYDYYFDLNIEHAKVKGINEVMPIRYMFCELNPLYLSATFKDIIVRFIGISKNFFNYNVNTEFVEFLQNHESFFHYYLIEKYWLILAEILYICVSYPLIMYVYTNITNTNTPDELVSQLIESDRVIKGCRQTKEDMLIKTAPTLNKFMIISIILSISLSIIGQCLPLIGNADAKGFIIHAVIVLDIKNQLKKMKREKSGKYIFYLHNIL